MAACCPSASVLINYHQLQDETTHLQYTNPDSCLSGALVRRQRFKVPVSKICREKQCFICLTVWGVLCPRASFHNARTLQDRICESFTVAEGAQSALSSLIPRTDTLQHINIFPHRNHTILAFQDLSLTTTTISPILFLRSHFNTAAALRRLPDTRRLPSGSSTAIEYASPVVYFKVVIPVYQSFTATLMWARTICSSTTSTQHANLPRPPHRHIPRHISQARFLSKLNPSATMAQPHPGLHELAGFHGAFEEVCVLLTLFRPNG